MKSSRKIILLFLMFFSVSQLGRSQTATSPNPEKRLPRYELGAQITVMAVNPPKALCFDLCFPSTLPINTEPGLGGRFTFNLMASLALEAETNFFVHDHSTFTGPAGHMFQGQFGVKAGKRFHRVGVFGKARPGFVGFTKVIQLTGTHTAFFGTTPFVSGDFRRAKQIYRSLDLGGVVEIYISPRVFTRVDIGDTIIRYGEYVVGGSTVSRSILRRAPETHHNFQLSAGVGFRF